MTNDFLVLYKSLGEIEDKFIDALDELEKVRLNIHQMWRNETFIGGAELRYILVESCVVCEDTTPQAVFFAWHEEQKESGWQLRRAENITWLGATREEVLDTISWLRKEGI